MPTYNGDKVFNGSNAVDDLHVSGLLTVNGSISGNGWRVGPTTINGSINVSNGIFAGLTVNGAASGSQWYVTGDTEINGSLDVSDSEFNHLQLATPETALKNSRVIQILLKPVGVTINGRRVDSVYPQILRLNN